MKIQLKKLSKYTIIQKKKKQKMLFCVEIENFY